jgi:hypothetical protein
MLTRCLGATALTLAVLGFAAAPALAADYRTVKVEKYGYELKIPEEFDLEGEIDKTTNWMYQPGSVKKSGGSFTKSLTGSIRIGGVGLSGSKSESGSSSGSGGLEPALGIYVNWVWMPDVSEKQSFDINLEQIKKDINSPDPDYTDVVVFDKDEGFDWEGLAFWFKEVPKEKDDEIHRWHIRAFGNNSSYTIGLTGTYGQFKKWGPVYEEVVKSFELIPLEEDE